MILTTLSVIVLVISLIMGLKFPWFRTRIYNIQTSKGSRELKDSSEPIPIGGVYRGQTFEAASAAPRVHQPANATASSSSYRYQPHSSSSKQVPPPSSSDHKFKSDSKKKYPASSSGNPPMGRPQPSGSKHDRNMPKHQYATPKNPLAKRDEHNERSRAEKPPRGTGQNTKPKNQAPVPKSILQTELPPPPVTHDGNSTTLKLNDDNHASRKPGHGGSRAPKPRSSIPLYVADQGESESET